jgi:hypothetical protein
VVAAPLQHELASDFLRTEGGMIILLEHDFSLKIILSDGPAGLPGRATLLFLCK